MSLNMVVVPDQIQKNNSLYVKVVRQGTIKFDRLLDLRQTGIAMEPRERLSMYWLPSRQSLLTAGPMGSRSKLQSAPLPLVSPMHRKPSVRTWWLGTAQR